MAPSLTDWIQPPPKPAIIASGQEAMPVYLYMRHDFGQQHAIDLFPSMDEGAVDNNKNKDEGQTISADCIEHTSSSPLPAEVNPPVTNPASEGCQKGDNGCIMSQPIRVPTLAVTITASG